MIHRDIKPENVIVSKDGSVTITDFGLARPEQAASGPTQAGIILGTPGYMAPEQALGKDVDQRADIYAFGVILYELITGDLPYDGETAFSIINQHISAPPPDLKKLRPETPGYLSELVTKLMAKEKDSRPQSMREVSEILRSKQGSGTRAAKPARDRAAATTDSGSAANVVEQVRTGRLSLGQALADNPDAEIRQTLQDAFRRELTVRLARPRRLHRVEAVVGRYDRHRAGLQCLSHVWSKRRCRNTTAWSRSGPATARSRCSRRPRKRSGRRR